MKDKKTLNLALSIIIAMCALVCVVFATSYLGMNMFSTKNIEAGETAIQRAEMNWRTGAPFITFASLGALFAIIKFAICSISATKSSEKGLGIIAVVSDIIILIGFILIVAAIASWKGDFVLGIEDDADDITKLARNVTSLIMVGAPLMLAGGVGSWIANHKAAE